jgi:hypothetical protein
MNYGNDLPPADGRGPFEMVVVRPGSAAARAAIVGERFALGSP